MYCYIKDGQLVTTSPELISKRQEEVTEEVLKTREIEQTATNPETGEEETTTITQEYIETVIKTPFVDGLVYDEVIETKLDGRITYENGKIIAYEDSAEKKEEDARLAEQEEKERQEYAKNRPEEIIKALGNLAREKDGLIILGKNTADIDAQIEALKEEYEALGI